MQPNNGLPILKMQAAMHTKNHLAHASMNSVFETASFGECAQQELATIIMHQRIDPSTSCFERWGMKAKQRIENRESKYKIIIINKKRPAC